MRLKFNDHKTFNDRDVEKIVTHIKINPFRATMGKLVHCDEKSLFFRKFFQMFKPLKGIDYFKAFIYKINRKKKVFFTCDVTFERLTYFAD